MECVACRAQLPQAAGLEPSAGVAAPQKLCRLPHVAAHGLHEEDYSGMGADGARKNDGEGAELATTRIVTRTKTAAAEADLADADGNRYDFLDAHEPEFMWQPVTGRSHAGEGEVATRPTWLERSRAFRRRSLWHNVLAALLTLAVIGTIAGGALAVLTGKIGPLRGWLPAGSTAKAPAGKAPSATAPQPAAPERAASPEPPPAEGSGASKESGVPEVTQSPPPGGEDGPPAAEPGAPERGER